MAIKLAVSYIKKQKGKTFALLGSISLAVMLIFSMFVIRDSGYDSQIKEAKNLQGDYHISFKKLSKDSVEILQNEKDIKELNYVKYLCNAVNKDSGITLDLNSFNKDYIDSLNYKIIGREPINDSEIIIEEKALKQMGIEDPLGKDIDLMLLNKYLNKKQIPQMESSNKSFKIVGIVQKPDKYYKAISGFYSQAFVSNKVNLPVKTEDVYKGTIYINSEKEKSQFVQRMIKKLNTDDTNLSENAEVNIAESAKIYMKYQLSNIKNLLILIIISVFIIYNIFNIILSDMSNQIGLMRAVGMSKKKIKRIFRMCNLIYILLGTGIGILLGMIFSYIGVLIVYGYNTVLSIEPLSIIFSFLVSIIAVNTSSCILVKRALKMSIVESIKTSDKYKRKSKRNQNKLYKNNQSIIIKFANRNFWRNKSRTILTIISISLVSTMFIINFASKSLIKKNIETLGGIETRSFGNIDKIFTGDYRNIEDIFYKVEDGIIQKVKEVEGVNRVEANFYNSDSYITINNENLSKDYIDELNRQDLHYKNEFPLLVKGYNDYLLNNIDSFIYKGENIINSNSNKYKQVILVNNIYSRVLTSFKAIVINDAKVGDILEIKLPIYKDGLEKYESFKVQVAGIMRNDYIATQDGNSQFVGAQVIFKEDDYKELTGQQDYNKLFIMADQGKLDSVDKNLNKIAQNYSLTSIGGKNQELQMVGGVQTSEEKLNVIYQCLIVLILTVNLIFIVRSNIIARKKELSTLRSIGMSIKGIKKMILFESEIYAIISVGISAIVATINYNINISKLNNQYLEIGYTKTVGYNIPLSQIIIVLVVAIAMCAFSVYISKDKIEGIDIIEGISEKV